MLHMDHYIQQHAAENPDRTAITFYDRKLTYAQLLSGYRSVAASLKQRHNLAPGAVVAVICERNIELVLAVLAVLHLDCIYLPVDKLNPRQRIEFILENSGASLIITDEDLPVGSQWTQVHIAGLMESGAPPLEAGAESGQAGFCIMYTSGTTGKPKGTLLHKEGVFNHLQAKIDCLSMDRDSVVAQNAGYYFVNSMWQIFSPLVAGAEMVIYDRHVMNSMERLAERIRDDRITIFQAVPSFWNKFFDYVGGGPQDFHHLRCLVSTSEKLLHSLVERCFALFPGITLVNAYGQTECCDDVLHYAMTGPVEDYHIPIGTPVPRTKIYLVEDDNRVCSQGEKGEICVAGVGLTGGYLNAPEQTENAFVTGSALGLDEPLIYRTGDIGYEREDGNIVYLGRKDFQVKINGFRVELYEIESVLLQHPEVVQAAVICVENGEDKRLIAFYIGAREMAGAEISRFLRDLLPGYMIPLEYYHIEAFPLTAMEKIDRKQLHRRMESVV